MKQDAVLGWDPRASSTENGLQKMIFRFEVMPVEGSSGNLSTHVCRT